jgi:hypothetical protein
LRSYYEECREILTSFPLVTLQHIPREHNEEANRLAQSASGYKESQEAFVADMCALGTDLAEDDWRKEIVDYLKDPSRKVSRKLKYNAIKFVLLDDNLFYKSLDGVLLRCLGPEEAKKMMGEVHDGICGAHQSAYRMKWVVRHAGCFWPTILEDCFEYYTSSIDLESLKQSQLIKGLNSCPWSSENLPKAWESNFLILLPIMPKLMARQRLLIRS